MKYLNLIKKIRNYSLAFVAAAAVMFVMPASVFADDTDIDDVIGSDSVNTIEADDNNIINSTYSDFENAGNEVGSGAELTFPVDTGCSDSLTSDAVFCYGVCCAECNETCDGTCCDLCSINNSSDIILPGNSEGETGDEFTDNGGENGDGSVSDNESGDFGDVIIDVPVNKEPEIPEKPEEDKPITDPADGSENSDENIIPSFPNEPDFPDDSYIGTIVPVNPEDSYQPEIGNEPSNGDIIGDSNENEEEIIYDDNLTDTKEDEIIFDDDVITDDKEPDDFNGEASDNTADLENPDNTDGEVSDNITDTEETDKSENENPDNTTDGEDADNSDSEASDDATSGENPDDVDNNASDIITDAEEPDNSDNENSDNIADGENVDNSDGEASDDAADDENSDDTDNENSDENDDQIINVVLPVSLSVAINPYNLNTIDDNDFHYLISSPEYSIKNYSNCDVSIVATVSASTTGGIVLSPYDLNGSEAEFTAFVYIEATNESNTYSDNYSNGANQLAFSNGAVSKEILTLADGSDGETTGYFKIKGQAVLPDDAYYSSDAMINMVITFDIAPVNNSDVSDSTVEGTENEDTESVENIPELAA